MSNVFEGGYRPPAEDIRFPQDHQIPQKKDEKTIVSSVVRYCLDKFKGFGSAERRNLGFENRDFRVLSNTSQKRLRKITKMSVSKGEHHKVISQLYKLNRGEVCTYLKGKCNLLLQMSSPKKIFGEDPKSTIQDALTILEQKGVKCTSKEIKEIFNDVWRLQDEFKPEGRGEMPSSRVVLNIEQEIIDIQDEFTTILREREFEEKKSPEELIMEILSKKKDNTQFSDPEKSELLRLRIKTLENLPVEKKQSYGGGLEELCAEMKKALDDGDPRGAALKENLFFSGSREYPSSPLLNERGTRVEVFGTLGGFLSRDKKFLRDIGKSDVLKWFSGLEEGERKILCNEEVAVEEFTVIQGCPYMGSQEIRGEEQLEIFQQLKVKLGKLSRTRNPNDQLKLKKEIINLQRCILNGLNISLNCSVEVQEEWMRINNKLEALETNILGVLWDQEGNQDEIDDILERNFDFLLPEGDVPIPRGDLPRAEAKKKWPIQVIGLDAIEVDGVLIRHNPPREDAPIVKQFVGALCELSKLSKSEQCDPKEYASKKKFLQDSFKHAVLQGMENVPVQDNPAYRKLYRRTIATGKKMASFSREQEPVKDGIILSEIHQRRLTKKIHEERKLQNRPPIAKNSIEKELDVLAEIRWKAMTPQKLKEKMGDVKKACVDFAGQIHSFSRMAATFPRSSQQIAGRFSAIASRLQKFTLDNEDVISSLGDECQTAFRRLATEGYFSEAVQERGRNYLTLDPDEDLLDLEDLTHNEREALLKLESLERGLNTIENICISAEVGRQLLKLNLVNAGLKAGIHFGGKYLTDYASKHLDESVKESIGLAECVSNVGLIQGVTQFNAIKTAISTSAVVLSKEANLKQKAKMIWNRILNLVKQKGLVIVTCLVSLTMSASVSFPPAAAIFGTLAILAGLLYLYSKYKSGAQAIEQLKGKIQETFDNDADTRNELEGNLNYSSYIQDMAHRRRSAELAKQADFTKEQMGEVEIRLAKAEEEIEARVSLLSKKWEEYSELESVLDTHKGIEFLSCKQKLLRIELECEAIGCPIGDLRDLTTGLKKAKYIKGSQDMGSIRVRVMADKRAEITGDMVQDERMAESADKGEWHKEQEREMRKIKGEIISDHVERTMQSQCESMQSLVDEFKSKGYSEYKLKKKVGEASEDLQQELRRTNVEHELAQKGIINPGSMQTTKVF